MSFLKAAAWVLAIALPSGESWEGATDEGLDIDAEGLSCLDLAVAGEDDELAELGAGLLAVVGPEWVLGWSISVLKRGSGMGEEEGCLLIFNKPCVNVYVCVSICQRWGN